MNAHDDIKVFVDAHVFDGPHQGTATFIRGIYTEMAAKAGITIYLAARDTARLQSIFPDNSRIVFIQYKSRSRFRRLLYEIPLLLKKYGIDYAHFQYIIPPSKSCRFIVTTHDVIFEEIPEQFSLAYRLTKRWLYKYAAAKADILTTVSQHSKDSIARHLAIKPAAIHITPNGVHPSFFERPDRETARTYIRDNYGIERFLLLVSRIEPRKNHLLLVRLFSKLQLAEKGYHLVFVGAPTKKVKELQPAIKGLTAKEQRHITFFNSINDKELQLFYQAASLFLYPSIGEGFGMPPLEAAAALTPVICSNAAALHEFHFFDKDHINPADEMAFGKRINELLSNPANEMKLEQRALHVKENYSWASSANKLHRLIKAHHLNESKP
jgi:glycosyltransferase involved in cell wall biosynthesis